MLYIFWFLFFLGCKNEKYSSEHEEIELSKQDTINLINPRLHYDYDDFVKSNIQVYIDSMNSYKKGDKIPKFLFNADFDFESKLNDWPNSNFVSAREEIFKKVDNVEILNEIINNSFFKTQFKSIGNGRPKIWSDTTSNYQLARVRLRILNR